MNNQTDPKMASQYCGDGERKSELRSRLGESALKPFVDVAVLSDLFTALIYSSAKAVQSLHVATLPAADSHRAVDLKRSERAEKSWPSLKKGSRQSCSRTVMHDSTGCLVLRRLQALF